MKLLKLLGENGEHWTFDAPARNAKGTPVGPYSPEAVKWDFVGGMMRAYRLGEAKHLLIAVKYQLNLMYPGRFRDVAAFNDEANWGLIRELIERMEL